MDNQNQSDGASQAMSKPQAQSNANPSENTNPQAPQQTPTDPKASQQKVQKKAITLPDEAGDTDLIEKEWVERAKDIVDHTKNNPHEQQRAINLMKAEYMKKRYGKDLQVGDGQ
jgi:hypothetical protein